jgi:hypothetical protein
MKNLLKTTAASLAILAMTGLASADPTVEVTEMDAYSTNLEPGYSDSIDLATLPQLDETVKMTPEFEQPSNFMSEEGVYRYAYYEKTGEWLTLEQARFALENESPVESMR